MGSLEGRLRSLESKASGAEWEIPIEVRLLLKATQRHQARERGEDPPPYFREELEEMHREDLETVAGGGVVGIFRDSAGWTSPESLDLLDEWGEDARRRLERVEDGEPLRVVYDETEDEWEA